MTEFSPSSVPEDGYYRIVAPDGTSQNVFVETIIKLYHEDIDDHPVWLVAGYVVDQCSIRRYHERLSETYKFYPFTINFNYESN